jgi:hypothetical protein
MGSLVRPYYAKRLRGVPFDEDRAVCATGIAAKLSSTVRETLIKETLNKRRLTHSSLGDAGFCADRSVRATLNQSRLKPGKTKAEPALSLPKGSSTSRNDKVAFNQSFLRTNENKKREKSICGIKTNACS